MASIAAKLNKIKKMGAHAHSVQDGTQLSPLAAEKESVRSAIEHSESYCTNLLKLKSTFSNLTNHQLRLVAQHVEQVIYKMGDKLMTEGLKGEECFIIEAGTLSATAKQPTGRIKEIEKLTKDAVVGDMCFVIDELRPFTLTVTSDVCKAFKLTKSVYQDVVDSSSTTIARDREKLAKDVIEKVKIFQKLTQENKSQLLKAMTPVVFQDGHYICKQGKLGKGFFVITEGKCMVSLNIKGGGERDIRMLEVGDFFGEIALLANSNKCTANVVARDSISCMSLSKADFHLLLSSIEEDIKRSNELKGMKHQEDFASAAATKGTGSSAVHSQLFRRRRITGVDIHNARSETRIDSILRRMAKFMVESLWNCMYSRFYRHLLLTHGMHPEALNQYGNYATEIIADCADKPRINGVLSVQERCREILDTSVIDRAVPVGRRSENTEEHDAHASFMAGVIQLNNSFKEKLCEHWCHLQFDQVVRKFKLSRHAPMTKIIGFQDELHHIYLILRGSVRIFEQQRFRGVYYEDLFPGEMFGDAGVEDRSVKGLLAQAITDVDLAVISIDDYLWINNATTGLAKATMDIQTRFRFLGKITILQDLMPNRLLKIATAMKQIHVNKDQQVSTRGEPMTDLHIVISGTINLVTSAAACHDNTAVITVLHPKDFFGLSGPLTSLCNTNTPLVETLDAVTASSCEILVLPANQTFLLDDSHDCLARLKTHFITKRNWRQERYTELMASRDKLAKVLHGTDKVEALLTTADVLIHQGQMRRGSGDRSLDSIHDVTGPKYKHHLHQLNDAADIEAFNVAHCTPTQRSLALHTKLGAGKKDVNLVHDEREFVLNLSRGEQEALHGARVPSTIAKDLPPVLGGHPDGTVSMGRSPGPGRQRNSQGAIRPFKSSDAHDHEQSDQRRTTHHYIADHRRSSAAHA